MMPDPQLMPGDKVSRLMAPKPVGIVVEVFQNGKVRVDWGRWLDTHDPYYLDVVQLAPRYDAGNLPKNENSK